jgi:hypothetical protein
VKFNLDINIANYVLWSAWSKVPLAPASGDHWIWIIDTCPCALVTEGTAYKKNTLLTN